MSITLKIFFNRVDDEATIDLEPASQVQRGSETFGGYKCGKIPILSFDLAADPEKYHVLVNMLIPKFFENCGSKDTHSMFLLATGNLKETQEFLQDRATGSFGCPKRLAPPHHTKFYLFNNQRFYPFLMTDFTVGYYVRDVPANGSVPEWPDYTETPTMKEAGVSIDHPIAFDPTLGIYMTRAAHVVFWPMEDFEEA